MSIDTSYAAGAAAGAGTPASQPTHGTLDKQAFLELLVTQLRYQDPTSPMDTSALMAQTTQLSTMESLTELSTTQREAFALQMRSSAAALVGQQITWTDADGAARQGVVTGVSYALGVPTVRVGDTDVQLDAVGSVTAPTATPTTPAPTTPAPTTPSTPASSDTAV